MTDRIKHLKSLVKYKQWANHRIFSALSGLSARKLEAPQPIVFGSLLRTLHHTFAMDDVWRAHLSGRSHDYSTRHPRNCPSLGELTLAQEAMDRWYIKYTEGLGEKNPSEVVNFEFIGGGRGAMTREEILLHVVNHGTYHRGHVAAMMYQFKTPPPTTDYPVFVREADTQQV